MVADGAKEKIQRAFDRCQNAYEHWQSTSRLLEEAKKEEDAARNDYSFAKQSWKETLKTCAPGDIGAKEC